MNRDIYSQAEQLNKKHRRKRTWYKILSVPICLVVFVTTYALILPAITMESTPDTYCGKVEPQGLVCTVEEHKHTEACFMNPEGEASSGETGDDVPADKPSGKLYSGSGRSVNSASCTNSAGGSIQLFGLPRYGTDR